MARIDRVSPLNFSSSESLKNKNFQNNVVTLEAKDPKLLSNFLTLLANQNKAVVSFGKNAAIDTSVVEPYGKSFSIDAFRPGLSKYAKYKIYNEASQRITGAYGWPKIDKIDAWMVTAETSDFMSDGGLGQVATDLPESFNSKRSNMGKMTVITPLYIDNQKLSLGFDEQSKEFSLHYKNGRVLKLDYLGRINVPLFNSNTNTNLQDNEVRVFRGRLNNTDYIFLDTSNPGAVDSKGERLYEQADIFNINSVFGGANNAYCVSEKSHTDAVTRMTYFSKSVYELIKAIKDGNISGLKAPNVLLLNDWHAGPVAALTKYMANAEADSGIIKPSVGRYFDRLPSVYIAHNAKYQEGSANDIHRLTLFGTLFEGFSSDILKNARSWDWAPDDRAEGLRNSLMKYNNYNASVAGMVLADRIVPVSEYGADELLRSNVKSGGLSPLMQARRYNKVNTLTPILNGYSKTLVEPSQKNMSAIMDNTRSSLILDPKKDNTPSVKLSDINLLPYRPEDAADLGEDVFDIKTHNKGEVIKLFKRIIEREVKLKNSGMYNDRRYLIENPETLKIPDNIDLDKTPLIVYSGRVDSQKGMDTIFWGAIMKYAYENKNKPADKLPIFIIGGNISDMNVYNRLLKMRQDMMHVNKNLAQRFIIVKGFLNTHLVATGADLFLVPSVFEPCGLTQIEAMAKGALPIASSTGGLVNTIKDGVDGFRTTQFFDQEGDDVKAQIYYEKGTPRYASNADAFHAAFVRALDKYYNDRVGFRKMQQAAMSNDFSWDKEDGSLDKYVRLMKTGKI